MIMDTVGLYSLNPTQFEALFSEHIPKNILPSLLQNARDGNAECLDVLFNLSLRQDDTGKEVEKNLFDVFSGKTQCHDDVCRMITDRALSLYRLSKNAQPTDAASASTLSLSSRLLYMAGWASDAYADEKQAITTLLQKQSSSLAYYESRDTSSIWDKTRTLTSDEIDAAISPHNGSPAASSINYPISLLCPSSGDNLLAQQISQQQKNSDFLHSPQYFPVNTGNHWVIFGLHREPESDTVKAFVFDSAHALSHETKRILSAVANKAGADDITFIDNNLQQHLKNSCGIFTIEGIQLLLDDTASSPENALADKFNGFTTLDPEAQRDHHLKCRHQIFESAFLSNT